VTSLNEPVESCYTEIALNLSSFWKFAADVKRNFRPVILLLSKEVKFGDYFLLCVV